jgi:hypothetical protein
MKFDDKKWIDVYINFRYKIMNEKEQSEYVYFTIRIKFKSFILWLVY